MKNKIIYPIIIGVLALTVGFFGGTKYQSSKAISTGSARGQFAQGQGRGLGITRNGGGQVTGTILSADSTSITVKLQDGSSKIVIIGNSTAINKSAVGSVSDLTVGTRVGVFGTTNTDGSVTAQNIQVNPTIRNATPSATTK